MSESKKHFWTSSRFASIGTAGHRFSVEDDITVLGLHVVAGVPQSFEPRICNAESALYPHRACIISRCQSMGTRWERWLRHVSPMLAFGSWVWLWDTTAKPNGHDCPLHEPLDAGPLQTAGRGVAELAHANLPGKDRVRWHSDWIRGQLASHWGNSCVQARTDFHPADGGLAGCCTLQVLAIAFHIGRPPNVRGVDGRRMGRPVWSHSPHVLAGCRGGFE